MMMSGVKPSCFSEFAVRLTISPRRAATSSSRAATWVSCEAGLGFSLHHGERLAGRQPFGDEDSATHRGRKRVAGSLGDIQRTTNFVYAIRDMLRPDDLRRIG